MAQQYDRTEQLKNAREAAEAMMGDMSPRERGHQKTLWALDWVYRWGWSSPSTLETVGGAMRSGLAARLVRKGLLARTKTEAAGAIRGVPAYILTLTELGLSEIERHRESLLRYELDPYRVNQSQIRHYQLAQSATANALESGAIADFQTERELAEASQPGVKQPDVIWLMPDDSKIGVEVELTAKWDRRLDEFVRACWLAVTDTQTGPARLDKIAVVSDSQAILKRYRAACTPGAELGIWERDQSRHWIKAKTVKVPPSLQEKMLWQFID
jgi:hypothetical protein